LRPALKFKVLLLGAYALLLLAVLAQSCAPTLGFCRGPPSPPPSAGGALRRLRGGMVIHSLSDLKGDDDAKGGVPTGAMAGPVDGEKLSKRFMGMYHEKQIGGLCAVHCINNLMQGPEFDEIEVALSLSVCCVPSVKGAVGTTLNLLSHAPGHLLRPFNLTLLLFCTNSWPTLPPIWIGGSVPRWRDLVSKASRATSVPTASSVYRYVPHTPSTLKLIMLLQKKHAGAACFLETGLDFLGHPECGRLLQVIQDALQRRGLSCIPLGSSEAAGGVSIG
jgi:hypothetical protein